ncbi:hypothetical protein OOT46_22485 [Aquabacterium sp. A7-Y]|uniref:hypothetical protein n=1 Tax=Aquabacterium sp. A7-Y TaxID=1349605 RepID=UPI00223CC18E|nr:hypothetical protein [Aquabacterium sp. A7-Y]MCW7540596.1 hypothetical protein [Aquabacterium sp. A7-Y]
MHRVIYLQPEAPAKPPEGAPCNGCGICCADEPCPLGQVLSGRRRGACAALLWSDGERRYRCGALSHPRRVLPPALAALAPVLKRVARRLIAAGSGCDSSVEASRPGA